MSKTQADLDQAVIAAAEALENFDTCPCGTQKMQNLNTAVRARREALRPHKAAWIEWLLHHNCLPTDDGMVLRYWNMRSDLSHEEARDLLARVLSAPDEPTEDSR